MFVLLGGAFAGYVVHIRGMREIANLISIVQSDARTNGSRRVTLKGISDLIR